MRASVHRIQDYLNHQDITSVKWVPTQDMLADPLTKKKADMTPLTQMLKTGYWKRVETERRGGVATLKHVRHTNLPLATNNTGQERSKQDNKRQSSVV